MYSIKFGCFLVISLLLNLAKVDNMRELRKLAIKFHHKPNMNGSVEIIKNEIKEFYQKIQQNEAKKDNELIEKRRNTIYREYLLSRVSGSIFKDIHSRF